MRDNQTEEEERDWGFKEGAWMSWMWELIALESLFDLTAKISLPFLVWKHWIQNVLLSKVSVFQHFLSVLTHWSQPTPTYSMVVTMAESPEQDAQKIEWIFS